MAFRCSLCCNDIKRPEAKIPRQVSPPGSDRRDDVREKMKRPSKNIGIAAKGLSTAAPGGAAATPEHTPKAPKIDGGGGTGATKCTSIDAAADSGATGDKELMPFRRQKTRDASDLRRRKTVEMEGDAEGDDRETGDRRNELGTEVTAENIVVNLRVARGPDWNWGDEDGGQGNTGVVLSFDKAKQVAQVLWEGGRAHKHYRFGPKSDLVISTGANSALGRRNSQLFFASKSQTLLIFDWDDTLFPTTYVPWQLCKVVLLTLARAPWVSESCKNFYASVGRLITQLKVPIIYAQEGIQVDYNKQNMSSDEEIERFWSSVKGKAIARECNKFYSQYEGQSWKNVISIGDSDFERVGTQNAMENYMRETGIESADGKLVDVNGHMYKVRTKTFKMLDEPTVEDRLQFFENNADDPEVLKAIDNTLRGHK
eukprot:Skav230326  [mRNA]  locus=scaffold430:612162:618302:+ [translate_table: standard]